jgi:hypothetical protein
MGERAKVKMSLPTDSAVRKKYPMFRGCLAYFAAALAGVARVSMVANEKHNPGEEMHHARGKSNDHADCIVRHLMDVGDIYALLEREKDGPTTGNPFLEEVNRGRRAALLNEADQLAWRALALSQELHEQFGGAPLAPNARA